MKKNLFSQSKRMKVCKKSRLEKKITNINKIYDKEPIDESNLESLYLYIIDRTKRNKMKIKNSISDSDLK